MYCITITTFTFMWANYKYILEKKKTINTSWRKENTVAEQKLKRPVFLRAVVFVAKLGVD